MFGKLSAEDPLIVKFAMALFTLRREKCETIIFKQSERINISMTSFYIYIFNQTLVIVFLF